MGLPQGREATARAVQPLEIEDDEEEQSEYSEENELEGWKLRRQKKRLKSLERAQGAARSQRWRQRRAGARSLGGAPAMHQEKKEKTKEKEVRKK